MFVLFQFGETSHVVASNVACDPSCRW